MTDWKKGFLEHAAVLKLQLYGLARAILILQASILLINRSGYILGYFIRKKVIIGTASLPRELISRKYDPDKINHIEDIAFSDFASSTSLISSRLYFYTRLIRRTHNTKPIASDNNISEVVVHRWG